jgi:uncharacterized membrane protein
VLITTRGFVFLGGIFLFIIFVVVIIIIVVVFVVVFLKLSYCDWFTFPFVKERVKESDSRDDTIVSPLMLIPNLNLTYLRTV